MRAPCITAIDITKKFADNLALNKVNLSIEEGELFSFLGPSGCGKTTLLRIIAGFEKPTSGQLLIDGEDILKTPPHKRPVNMVFQNYALFPHLSIEENVAFGLKARGKTDKGELKDRVDEALRLVRLESFALRYPLQLSGGQQQRVALARAVINRPRVLLLDEPLSALDPQIREEMQDELKSLQRQLNMTFIMVTHDQNEALAMSHRVAVFSSGNIEQVGPPSEIYEKPATVFVASFIGQTNLIRASVMSENAQSITLALGNEIYFIVDKPLNEVEPSVFGDEVIFYVKPQAITLEEQGSSDLSFANDVNWFEAKVETASYQGYFTEFVLALKNGHRLKVIAAQQSGHGKVREGSFVFGSMPISACSFFPAGSSKK